MHIVLLVEGDAFHDSRFADCAGDLLAENLREAAL